MNVYRPNAASVSSYSRLPIFSLFCGLLSALFASPTLAATASVPGTIQAESMESRPVGGISAGFWNIWSNGEISNPASFPSSGTYKFTISGHGQMAGGVAPIMELRIDGKAVGSVSVSATKNSDYVLSATVSAGVHKVGVAFVNDGKTSTEDRNLLIDRIAIALSSAASPPSSSAKSVPSTVEAESMATKSTGSGFNGYWGLWSNGYVEDSFNFPSAGSYVVNVVGYASLSQSVGADVQIRIDGVAKATKRLSSTSSSTLSFTVDVAAGVHKVAVAYTNDLNTGGQDRNLVLDKVSIAKASSSGATPTPTPKPTATPVPPAATPTPVPPASTGGVSYPFGSHKVAYKAGIRPAVSQDSQDAAIKSLYNSWKSTLRSNCGGLYVYKGDNYAAVSEGTGYGMLISVIMAGYDSNARNQFDQLYKFAKSKPAYNVNSALMDWAINFDCSSGGSGYNAMDGDLDIAMALLMADKQWGSSGTYNYKAEAIKIINAMKTYNNKNQTYTGGGPSPDISRTSDYMIGHFRAFRAATGDAYWDSVISKSFELMSLMQSKYAASTGLIPDFIVGLPNNPVPSPGGRIESNLEGYYAYNACRIPWRLATDYVTTADSRSRDITVKLMNFFRSKSGGQPSAIASGYMLDGTPVGNFVQMSFVGPITAGAMVDSANQSFLNSLWSYTSPKLAGNYYNNELQLLSLIVASGNWWQP